MTPRERSARWTGLGLALAGAVGLGVFWGQHLTISQATPNPTTDALSLAFSQVAQNARPSVVNIRAAGPSLARGMGGATGSGFVIDRDGHVVTNLHVVQNAARLTVRLADGTQLPARFVAGDAETDLAVLKLVGRISVPPLAFGDSDALRVGEWVVAIGSPFGLEATPECTQQPCSICTGQIDLEDHAITLRL
ncbi:MAG: trypsin-like peptidase domain-containing protein, partial [Chloracidobacterium sp.]